MATVSSHILNAVDGTHAGGIAVTLVNLRSGRTLFEAETDAGGRLSESVDLSDALPSDLYQITFRTGPYWDKAGAPPGRMPEIVLHLLMPDPHATYHSPIIASPNGYSLWVSE